MTVTMLTSKETAKRFQVCPKTISRWVAMGIFPRPLKIGGAVRFRVSDVEAFEDSGWLDNRLGRPGGFATGWLPDQSDIATDELGDENDVKDEDVE